MNRGSLTVTAFAMSVSSVGKAGMMGEAVETALSDTITRSGFVFVFCFFFSLTVILAKTLSAIWVH